MDEIIKVKWHCPQCKIIWGTSQVKLVETGEFITKSKDFKIDKKFGNFKQEEGKSLYCPKCGYEYDRMDIYLNIAKAKEPEAFAHWPKRWKKWEKEEMK